MKLKLLIVALFCSVLGWGQFNISAVSTNYTQDFNTLTTGTWTDNTTLTGWYARTDLTASITSYAANTGTTTTAGLYAFGVAGTNPLSDRGLGFSPSNAYTGASATGKGYIGWRLKNNTGVTIASITVTWSGEQWRRDNASAQTLNLFYQNAATVTGLTGGVWTAAPSTFTSPQLSATAIALDGNAATNRTANISVVITVNIPAGEEIMLRWEDLNDSGTDHLMAIDDVTVNASPASSNTITTDTAITGSPFCVSASTGASVSVPFTSVGTFNSGNIYTAQLSNAAGSFASPVSIGTVTSTANSGTIAATIPAGTAAGTGYRIRVVSSNPVVTGTDNTVNLTVQVPAAITAQPSTTVQNLCQGSAATALSVTATGTTLTYQWYSNTTAATSGGTPVGTSSASYTPVTTATGTLYYYCVVSAACGASVTSNVSGAVNVTAIPSAPAGTINISANPSCGAATLTYSAPNANIYWQTTATGISTANPTTSSFTSLATAGTYIRYVRELNGTCWGPATASASFTIVEPVVITVQPPNRVITDGANTTFTVTATGTTPTYQWQVDTGSGFVDLVNGAPYSNVTTATMTITAAPITMNGYVYRCVVSGAAPCGSVTSNNGTLTVSYTAPNNPTNITPCYGNNTLGLSWTASSGGAAPDGYMVFALAGATTPAATSAVAGNASLYTANSDFSLATVVTASLGKCVYKGSGTSVTVTGLTNLSNYSFKVVAYRGNTGTGWSSGITALPTGSWAIPTTNITIDMPEVTGLAASIASGQSALTWNRPTPLACYDQYLVVANQGAVVFTPSGDGTAYTPNTVYSGPNQVVYNGTGAGVTVTGLTNGTNYCYKVFVRRGTEWSDGVTVCQTPNIVYCALTATNTGFEHISNVTVGSDINNSTASSGYANYTAQIANTTIGLGTSLSVTITPSYTTDNVYAYVDWNKDGDWLDAGENITLSYTAVSTSFTASGTITPPATALTGNTRMRVIVVDGTVSNACNSSSNFTYGEVEDYTINVLSACVPTHTVTSFTPTAGPVGTEVTINGTGLTGATVTFSGVNATVVSNTGTQIVVVIPAGATTGMLSVKDSQPCAVDNAYVIITNNNTSCEGAASTTDLIIYDIHDEQTGSGGFITLYNGTASTVNLVNYTLWRTTDHDNGGEVDYANLTGTIAPGALGILKVSVGSCGPASTNGTIDGGFNENDGIQLRNAAGTVIIDDVDAYPTGPGYYMVRNAGALNARTSYVAADWSTIPLAAGVCYPSAGLVLPTGGAVPPMVTSQPSYTPSCGSTAAILTTVGAEGYAGGNTLAYQWYFAAPGSATWTAVADGGIYSGATTASLSISTITGVVNYQYYCQIRENLATCYTATNAVKVTDSNATTWNGLAWSNGVPTLTKAAIIDGTYVTATNGNFSCCSLTVNATRALTISSGGYVEVQNDVTNNGTFTVLNNGSLIQINDLGVNIGNISYERIAMARNLDYVYWSSPVAAFNVNNLPNNYRYIWNTTIANTNGGQGNWVAASGNMIAGKGYIARASNGSATPVATTTSFVGVPNNGVINMPILRGTYQGGDYAGTNGITITRFSDNWNLVGNPYPSSINVEDFLSLNTNIEGAVRIWTHGTLPSSSINNPFYGSYQANYTPDDYITHNGVGTVSGPIGFNGFIAGGQGFMINMLDGAAGSDNLIFNNSLRSKTYNNSQFYRTSNEKNRIWLDLINNSNNTAKRTLVGYVSNATYEKDRLYDAFTSVATTMNLYSIIGSDKMTIQGRQLPFDANDKVNLGYFVPTSGNYSIGIAALDGLFASGQNIYLEDKLLGVIHDLRSNPYSFSANAGEVNNRFVLRYTNETLGGDDFINNSDVLIFSSDLINIQSFNQTIQSVTIHNVLGQLLVNELNVNSDKLEIKSLQKNKAPLIIQVTLENGKKIVKKLIY